jgi:hypothetical protein
MFVLSLIVAFSSALLAFWPLDPRAPNPARAAALALLSIGQALGALILAVMAWWSPAHIAQDARHALALVVLGSACAGKGLLRHRPVTLAVLH